MNAENVFKTAGLLLIALSLSFYSVICKRRAAHITQIAEGEFSHVEYRYAHAPRFCGGFDVSYEPTDMTVIYFKDGSAHIFDHLLVSTWASGTRLAVQQDGNGLRRIRTV